MLSRLRIGPKLLLAPASVVLLLVTLAGVAWTAMTRQNGALEDIVGQRATHMRAASELVIVAQRGHAQVYQLHAWIGGGFPAHRIAPLVEAIHRQHALARTGLRRLAATTAPGSAERRHVERAAAAHAVYVRAVLDVIEIVRADQSVSASVMSRAETAFATVAGSLNDLSQLEQRLSEKAFGSAAADLRMLRFLAPGMIVLAIGVSLHITLAVRRALLAEIRGIGAAAAGLASGDLTVRGRVLGNDEIAETSRALDAGIRNLNGTLRAVLESARAIGAASRDLALGNLNLGTRATFRAGSLERTASSMDELAATVHLTADNAQAANRLAESATSMARQGEGMVEHLAATLAAARDNAQRMADIGARIDALASETGTLALNMVLAGARAGTEGREPVLMADQVRTLALDASAAARQIRALGERSVAEIEGGSARAAQAGHDMGALSDSVRQVGDIVSRIRCTSAEQATGLLDVNQEIVQMDQVTQRNSQLVEEVAESARSLQMQALSLSRAVAAFRLDEAPATPAPLPSSRAEVDLREVLKDGRRDASQPGPGERGKGARGHLRLAASRE